MGEPKELALRYPQSCPFCSIAAAYRYAASAASPSPAAKQPQRQDESARSRAGQNITAAAAAASSSSLLASIPSSPSAIDPAKVSPAAYVVLSAPRVLAFLDIMPMTRGHLLVTTRRHRRKVEELVGGGGSIKGEDGDENGEEGECKGEVGGDEDEDEEGEEGRDIGMWVSVLRVSFSLPVCRRCWFYFLSGEDEITHLSINLFIYPIPSPPLATSCGRPLFLSVSDATWTCPPHPHHNQSLAPPPAMVTRRNSLVVSSTTPSLSRGRLPARFQIHANNTQASGCHCWPRQSPP